MSDMSSPPPPSFYDSKAEPNDNNEQVAHEEDAQDRKVNGVELDVGGRRRKRTGKKNTKRGGSRKSAKKHRKGKSSRKACKKGSRRRK